MGRRTRTPSARRPGLRVADATWWDPVLTGRVRHWGTCAGATLRLAALAGAASLPPPLHTGPAPRAGVIVSVNERVLAQLAADAGCVLVMIPIGYWIRELRAAPG